MNKKATASRLPSKIAKPISSRQSSRANSPTPSESGALTEYTDDFIVGDRVWVGGTKPGYIQFIGETKFAPGEWAGVVLDEAVGKNDGTVGGVRYFMCEPKRGVFSRLSKLTRDSVGSSIRTSPKPSITSDNEEIQSRRVSSPTNGSVSTSSTRRAVSPTDGVTRLTKQTKRVSASPNTGGQVLTTTTTTTVKHDAVPAASGHVKIGDRVLVGGTKAGVLRYVGTTDFAPGNWCGVELDEPLGKNDGTVAGKKYFDCKMKYGLFAPTHKVTKQPGSSTVTRVVRTTRVAANSPTSSLHKRSGSRESLASMSTTSQRSTPGSRKSGRPQAANVSATNTALQETLREKEQHIDQLLKERDMDRSEVARAAAQVDANTSIKCNDEGDERKSLLKSKSSSRTRDYPLKGKLKKEAKNTETHNFQNSSQKDKRKKVQFYDPEFEETKFSNKNHTETEMEWKMGKENLVSFDTIENHHSSSDDDFHKEADEYLDSFKTIVFKNDFDLNKKIPARHSEFSKIFNSCRADLKRRRVKRMIHGFSSLDSLYADDASVDDEIDNLAESHRYSSSNLDLNIIRKPLKPLIDNVEREVETSDDVEIIDSSLPDSTGLGEMKLSSNEDEAIENVMKNDEVGSTFADREIEMPDDVTTIETEFNDHRVDNINSSLNDFKQGRFSTSINDGMIDEFDSDYGSNLAVEKNENDERSFENFKFEHSSFLERTNEPDEPLISDEPELEALNEVSFIEPKFDKSSSNLFENEMARNNGSSSRLTFTESSNVTRNSRSMDFSDREIEMPESVEAALNVSDVDNIESSSVHSSPDETDSERKPHHLSSLSSKRKGKSMKINSVINRLYTPRKSQLKGLPTSKSISISKKSRKGSRLTGSTAKKEL